MKYKIKILENTITGKATLILTPVKEPDSEIQMELTTDQIAELKECGIDTEFK